MEIAVATQTHPRQWVDEPPEMLATVIDVMKEHGRRQRGRR